MQPRFLGPFVLVSLLTSSAVAQAETSHNADSAAQQHPSDKQRPFSGGISADLVMPIGSYQGGIVNHARVGWEPIPSLRLAAVAGQSTVTLGRVDCDCDRGPCCAGANPSLFRAGIELEWHPLTQTTLDPYVAVGSSLIYRNQWRPSASGDVGLDFRIGSLRVGPNVGVMLAGNDTAEKYNENRAIRCGVRALWTF